MVSPTEAGFNLREMLPLSRNILHSREISAPAIRDSERTDCLLIGYRVWPELTTRPKGDLRLPTYLISVRDTAKSGIGCFGNRHLSHSIKFNLINVGGSCQDANVSSPRMPDKSVGGVIVLGAQESCVHGEGRQEINISLVESNGKSDEFQACRKVKL